jgi:hypothetical protein
MLLRVLVLFNHNRNIGLLFQKEHQHASIQQHRLTIFKNYIYL